MDYSTKSFTVEPEILANDHFATIPVTLDFTGVTNLENGVKVVKAGSPISAAGVVDNATAPIGILRKNCYETRPNAALIVHGFIDKTKAQTASGLTLATETWGSKLPMIGWR